MQFFLTVVSLEVWHMLAAFRVPVINMCRVSSRFPFSVARDKFESPNSRPLAWMDA